MTDPVTDFLHQAGPLTLVVIIACLAIYGLDAIGLPIFDELAFHPTLAQFTDWQAWRYFTPAFIHFSVLHLVFNLLWWWYLGPDRTTARQRQAADPAAGRRRPAQPGRVLRQRPAVWRPLRGGLCPARLLLAAQQVAAGLRLTLPPALMGFMLFWLALGFFDLLGTRTANMAHLAGLLVGLLQGWLDRHHQPA